VHDNRVVACHIAHGNTRAQDYFPPGPYGMNDRVIENGNITVGNDGTLNLRIAPDDRIPAADIKGNA